MNGLVPAARSWLFKACVSVGNATRNAVPRRENLSDISNVFDQLLIKDIAGLLKEEIDTVGFVSTQRIEELITAENVRLLLPDSDQEKISRIVHEAPRLLAALVFIEKHVFAPKLLDLRASDDLFRYLKPEGAVRTSMGLVKFSEVGEESLQKDLYNVHGKFPFPFEDGKVSEYGPLYTLPYESAQEIGSGGFGSVFAVKVARGHLRGHFSDHLIAEKQIKIDEGNQEHTRNVVSREEATLRARRHPHVVPLLASFVTKSEGEVDSLHLLMPLATGGDMQKWMMSSSTPSYPPFLGESSLSSSDFIYTSIQTIISALAYIHSDRLGMWTGHYDIKPGNILLFFEDGKWIWKISDFGNSFLVPVGTEPRTHRHVGTFDYQPPEYTTSFRRDPRPLSFDVFAMGCVIIELAILIVYPTWRDDQVRHFYDQRANESGDHPFASSKTVVDDWICQLRGKGSLKLQGLLDIAEMMIVDDPQQRLLAFDAAIDVWALCNPDQSSAEFELQCKAILEGSGPSPKFGKRYNPHDREKIFSTLHRDERSKIRTKCLAANGWRKPLSNRLDDSTSSLLRKTRSFTTLPTTYAAKGLCGRDQDLRLIESQFEVARTVGIYGIGGIGKSHVAWRYAVDLRNREWGSGNTMHIFWVNAKNMSTLKMSYAAIARAVGIPDVDEQESLHGVKQWLEHRDHYPWLMIFDGADDNYTDLSAHCPWNEQNVLVTTKDRAVALGYCEPDHVINLEGLEAQGNLALFRQQVPSFSTIDEEPAKALAAKLYLPLYIELMSAYINHNEGADVSISRMNEQFHRKKALAEYTAQEHQRRPGFQGVMPDSFTFFDIVFESLKYKFAKFREAFRLLCLFPKDAIDIGTLRASIEPGKEDEILSCLTNLCFIKKASKSQYSMHEIVQTMFLDWITREDGIDKLWRGRLLALSIQWRQYNDTKHSQLENKSTEPRTSMHILKLRFRIHALDFIDFLKDNSGIDGYLKPNAANAMVTFAKMFKDENEFHNAILLLEQVVQREYEKPDKWKPGEFEEDTQMIRFRGWLELVATYKARASGRHSFNSLETALKHADHAIEKATAVGDSYMNRRLCATRVEVLLDIEEYEEARRSLADMKEEVIDNRDEDYKHRLRVLDLQASLHGREGKIKCDIKILQEAQILYHKHDDMISGAPYNEQERKEMAAENKQERLNMCLKILEVLQGKASTADSDMQEIAKKAYDDAWEMSFQILEATQELYDEEAPRLGQHRHIQRARLGPPAVMLRYGLWRGENVYKQLKDCVGSFERILNTYRGKLGLTHMDKDVRQCAYYLRESLHWLVQQDECGVRYVSMMEELEREYGMDPWKDQK